MLRFFSTDSYVTLAADAHNRFVSINFVEVTTEKDGGGS